MKSHRVGLFGVLVVSVMFGRASAQPVLTLIPDEIKKKNALSAGDREVTANVTKTRVSNLIKGAPDVQKSAREGLSAEVNLADGKTLASAPFLDEYSLQVNNLLGETVLTGEMRARLNAAIVVSRVAEVAPTMRLVPLTSKMLGRDQPAAITLWGLRAAGPQIVKSLELGQPSPLIPLIVPAATEHDEAYIHQEAYRALVVETDRQVKRELVNRTVIPEMIKLLQHRAAQYNNGLPDDPDTDAVGAIFHLTKTGVFDSLSAPQRKETLALMARMLDAIASNVSKVEQHQLDQLAQWVRYVGGCVKVLSQNPALKDGKLAAATAPAIALLPRATAKDVAKAAETLATGLKELPS